MGFLLRSLGVVLLAFVLLRAYQICMILQPWKEVFNHAPGPCRKVAPIEHGAEDIEILPNGKAIFSSGLKLPVSPLNRDSHGRFYSFDFHSPQDDAQPIACSNCASVFPEYGTAGFAPHGISVLQEAGQTFVFVVNHPPRNDFEKDSIEKFLLNTATNTVEHVQTYTGDYMYLMNDVVATGPDSFYATNWLYARTNFLVHVEGLLARVAWSNVFYYNQGDVRVVVDGLIMPNGISMSQDKKYIYVVHFGASGIGVYERSANGSLTHVQFKHLPTTNGDNISVDKSSGDLWVGCQPTAYKVVRYLSEAQKPGHSRGHGPPSQVLRIKTKDGHLTDITEMYVNDGKQMSSASSAVFHRETSAMLIGSVENQLLYCQVKTE